MKHSSNSLFATVLEYMVPKCLVTANKLLEQAACRDHIKSQTSLATFYLEGGGGLPRDVNQAVYWFTIAASCSDEDRKKSLDSTYQCAFARYYLGLINKVEPPLNNSDGSLDLAKYWLQKAIDCNFSPDDPTEEDEDVLDSCKNIKGKSQYALAVILFDIWEKNYASSNVSGPVPFPTIERLLHKAHENGEEGSLEVMQAFQTFTK